MEGRESPVNPKPAGWGSFVEALIFAVLVAYPVEALRKFVPKKYEEIGNAVAITAMAIFLVLGVMIALSRARLPLLSRIRIYLLRMLMASIAACRSLALGSRWTLYAVQGFEPCVWRIRSAVQREYFAEENLDLSGLADLRGRGQSAKLLKREGRPLIVTNFPRYARLVEGAVDAALAACGANQVVFCLTTLSMRISKWFNFDDVGQCSRSDWDNYLTFLEDRLVIERQDRVTVARICLVHEKNNPSQDRKIQLSHGDVLKEDLRKAIWLNQSGKHDEVGGALKPLNASERERIYGHLNDAIKNVRVIDESDGQRNAYVIAPHDALELSLRGGSFSPLGKEFISRYHSRRKDGGHYAYYAEVPWEHYRQQEKALMAAPPLDFFYLSLIPKALAGKGLNELALAVVQGGVFCLAAVPDEALSMVFLHLLDRTRTPRHFEGIQDHVENLLNKARTLQDLLNDN